MERTASRKQLRTCAFLTFLIWRRPSTAQQPKMPDLEHAWAPFSRPCTGLLEASVSQENFGGCAARCAARRVELLAVLLCGDCFVHLIPHNPVHASCEIGFWLLWFSFLSIACYIAVSRSRVPGHFPSSPGKSRRSGASRTFRMCCDLLGGYLFLIMTHGQEICIMMKAFVSVLVRVGYVTGARSEQHFLSKNCEPARHVWRQECEGALWSGNLQSQARRGVHRKDLQILQAPGIALAPCHGALRPGSAPFSTRGLSGDGGSFRPLRAGQGPGPGRSEAKRRKRHARAKSCRK